MGAPGTIRVGTSGFSYKEWLGGFYPARLPGAKMLDYYAARLRTVEINYTFRRMPKPAMLEGWAARTPEDFRFALKAPQRITHEERLQLEKGGGESLKRFVEVASVMGARLAPALFQLPPWFRADVARLRAFLTALDRRIPAAFEFRHASWFDSTVLAALSEAGAALCIAETDALSAPLERTAPYVYLRLRKTAYDDAALEVWAARIAEFARGGEVFVYFKHEESAPELASKMNAMLGVAGGKE